jgi:hypothetical protein
MLSKVPTLIHRSAWISAAVTAALLAWAQPTQALVNEAMASKLCNQPGDGGL